MGTSKLDLVKIFRGAHAFSGVLCFIIGLVHLCVHGWGHWSITKLQSNGSVVCGFVAFLLMVNGIYMVVAPIATLWSKIRKVANIWNVYLSIAWNIVTGIICLFFLGYMGLFFSIAMWLVAIFGIVIAILSCNGIGKRDESSSSDEIFNP